MPNNLTGDYEAVLQVSVRQINGILATLHQNGAASIKTSPTFPGGVAGAPVDLSPSFPHSEIFRVGDTPAAQQPGMVAFNKWLVSEQKQYQLVPVAGGQWTVSFDTAPPGLVTRLEEQLVEWNDALLDHIMAENVRGRAQVQLSSPTIELEPSTSRVIASVYVRAHYVHDPGSQVMPAPVHGCVRVWYELRPRVVRTENKVKKVLDIPVPAQDERIQYIPMLGTALDDEIAEQIRKALRKSFKPMKVDLPDDFKFFEFKALGSSGDQTSESSNQTLVLPFQLSDAEPPAGGLASVTNHLRGESAFAIGVSKEYVQSQMQGLIDAPAAAQRIKNKLPEFLRDNYTVTASVAPLVWKPGAFEVSGSVNLVADEFYLLNGWVSFNQGFTLELDVPSQTVGLKPLGEPEVKYSWWLSPWSSDVKNGVKSAMSADPKPLKDAFSNARTQLNKALFEFDDSALANYDSIEISLDGITVRGAISTKLRTGPVVDPRVTEDGHGFTAFHSWIPGGRITNHHWSWQERVPQVHDAGGLYSMSWADVTRTSDQPHEFGFRYQPHELSFGEPEPLAKVCLTLHGSRISPNGHREQVVSVTRCARVNRWGVVSLPSDLGVLFVPELEPDPPQPTVPIPPRPDERTLDERISAHINLAAEGPPEEVLSVNHVVYFADWRADQPLAGLHRALGQLRRQDAALAVVVVLPAGGLHATRREIEARLGLSELHQVSAEAVHRERRPVRIELTEDYGVGWSRTFGVRDVPATFLVIARGESVWYQEGQVDPEGLAAALEEHMLPTPEPRFRLMELSVREGDRPPNVFVEDDRGEPIDLRRLRDRPVLLNFWQSWSQPCLHELHRLQELQDRAGRNAPVIVALCADHEPRAIDEVRRQHKLTFVLAHDAWQREARRFKVRCWPTTVSINPDGMVSHVQFGLSRVHRLKDAEQAT
jgi:peroxiredoxin